jgi:hypothetical protein
MYGMAPIVKCQRARRLIIVRDASQGHVQQPNYFEEIEIRRTAYHRCPVTS